MMGVSGVPFLRRMRTMSAENKQLKIVISAGELSGDEHAAHVCEALRKIQPNVALRGMGGAALRKAGVDLVVDSEKSGSVMGFIEVIKKLDIIFAALSQMKQLLKEWRPDVLVIVDYPDFNLRLAAYAKSIGIPVISYIPPTVWAWRSRRIHKIKEVAKQVALIYPQEKAFYKKYGVDQARYVGHPLSDTLPLQSLSTQDREKLRRELGIPTNPNTKVVALLPGSRRGEIERHIHVLLDGYRLLKSKHPEVWGVLPMATESLEPEIVKHLKDSDNITVLHGDSIRALQVSDAGALKSGTSNLQAAFLNIPFVMFFVAPKLTEWIVKLLVKIKEYSPVNVIRSGTVVELLQSNVSAEKLSSNLEAILFDTSARAKILEGLLDTVKRLKTPDDDPLFVHATTTAERVALMIVSAAHT